MRTFRRCAALAIAVAAFAIAATAQAEVTDEEYAVYRALLQQVEWRSGKLEDSKVKQYVIRDTTCAEEVLDDRRKASLSNLDPSSVAMFEARNRAKDHLDVRRFAGMKVRLVSDRERDIVFFHSTDGDMTFDGRAFRKYQADGWEYFDGKYRGSQGLLALSRVGFSEDGRHALLYYDNQSHFHGGEGCLVYLEKTPEGWSIRKQLGLWNSYD